jgi:hypothetical protein
MGDSAVEKKSRARNGKSKRSCDQEKRLETLIRKLKELHQGSLSHEVEEENVVHYVIAVQDSSGFIHAFNSPSMQAFKLDRERGVRKLLEQADGGEWFSKEDKVLELQEKFDSFEAATKELDTPDLRNLLRLLQFQDIRRTCSDFDASGTVDEDGLPAHVQRMLGLKQDTYIDLGSSLDEKQGEEISGGVKGATECEVQGGQVVPKTKKKGVKGKFTTQTGCDDGYLMRKDSWLRKDEDNSVFVQEDDEVQIKDKRYITLGELLAVGSHEFRINNFRRNHAISALGFALQFYNSGEHFIATLYA